MMPMKFLFDIGHPAHIHLLRNFAVEMQTQGHDILFTIRDKEMTVRLLEEYHLPFVSFGKPKKGVWGKMLGLFGFNWKLWKVARRFKPDFLLSHGSIYAAHVSKLIGKPHISFEDTGNMEQILLYKPFTDAILVSDSFSKHFGKKTVIYPGYHELAYLHPNWFQSDVKVLKRYGLDPAQNIILIRFVSWGATHDLQHSGIPLALKEQAAETFAKFGRVLITSEKALPPALQPYQIKINPVDIFHIMAHSRLLFGESATMASEAAVLGVPAIYIDSTSRDYTQEQEKKYGLVFNFSENPADIERAIAKGVEILSHPQMQVQFSKNHKRLLEDKVDVTHYLQNFIHERYLNHQP
jgi:hypothetical protein